MILKFMIGIIILVTISFINRHCIIRVNGDSMYPTLKNGQFRVITREPLTTFEVGRIYVYISPVSSKMVIKRLKNIDKRWNDLFFVGDNSNDSEDSRHYGYVDSYNVLGKLVTGYEVLLRVFYIDKLTKRRNRS